MGRTYLFSEDANGRVREVKVDPKHLDKQLREERAAGRTPTVLDEDERIRFGQLTNDLNNRR
ncbi:hypothetical protein IRY44_21920 [Micromonospora sp. ANENR4]|uniref:hypothetical protein n=2 Tax=Micromonosporaceae TaxID=28056 RepID=UPI0018904080|nr:MULTISPECIES: hypothetical protein [unclassified Micromonospora]MBF5032416.1 hypothetical protein [Micromonospora sp. ANENR4]MCZ7472766.1 hypothetical protein [Micromonospora sp. WMMC273]MCZ7478782.1 hypothetical protein [Micromonospora sp. WMMC273]MCZ7478805.1 hypothetical protein [Micromonospora sp. WMMC273]